MEVLIVGAGAMGTWFGECVDWDVAYADVNRDAAASAAERVGGTVADLEGSDAYDIVCLAVPIGHVTSAIAEHAGRADRAVVDVSGVMAEPLVAMADHAPDTERVSLHPLFAPARAPGSIAVAVDEGGPTTEALLAQLEGAGNTIRETTASEHDDAMETVQAATHAAILAFALAAEPAPEGFATPTYAGLTELVAQLTDGTPRVYADIQEAFDGADAVAAAGQTLADADPEEIEALYETAAERWTVATSAANPPTGGPARDGDA